VSETVEVFRIDVPEAVIDDLRERLARSRLPEPIAGAGWDYGVDFAWLRDLLAHWRAHYDWRAWERRLNTLPQFRTRLDGHGIHFVHRRSPEPDALPLLLAHGWPGSFFEFHKVVEPLADPRAHGGRPEDAFHVVCPSMPGYAFSDPPRAPGVDARSIAALFAGLMRRLGYARYGVQGGDWGSAVASWMALLAPEACCGIHLNLLIVPRPRDEDPAALTAPEREAYEATRRFLASGPVHVTVQGQEPDALGVALEDSPAGLAAWIAPRLRAWSDCGGDLERRFPRDELLTHLTLYWVTRSITTSMRLYREAQRAGALGRPRERIEVPTGCALFPRELFRPPRRWVERAYRVERWTEMPRGGHFAALEEPELLIEDVRAFFRPLRGSSGVRRAEP
jgi:epoxide hydrolase